ncbi:MAG: MATE family efflux transporter, partial [Prevotella pleuritidis]|nr:MATE family efflux transporter [Hoylesella pleuritidis]
YFDICNWGAPAMLCLYGLTGWFIGMQNTRIPMLVSIIQNVVNIAASLVLVYGAGMQIEGVALGTLIAQWSGWLFALMLWAKHYARLSAYIKRLSLYKILWEQGVMWHFFTVNRDIFLRTLFLVAVNLFFTAAGARQGNLVLSVNTLLLTMFTLFSYVMDGFAFAGEALSGRYYGAHNWAAFTDVCRRLMRWGIAMTAIFTVVYAIGGNAFLGLLTDEEYVIAAAARYFWWAVLIPASGALAFILDGIFIGLTFTRMMFSSSIIASVIFFLIFFSFFPILGNHALWLAFIAYLLMRGVVLLWYFGRFQRQEEFC